MSRILSRSISGPCADDDDGVLGGGHLSTSSSPAKYIRFLRENQSDASDVYKPATDYASVYKICGQLKKLLDLPILFAIIFVHLISFVLVLNIEQCSPLVLFSWWRNKIS
jgi:hypothetical protein